MRKRILGSSGVELTTIGLGTWAIGGGDWAFGWGAQDEAESVAALHEALDAGINWIDTAPVYGLGRAEEVVGKVLAERLRSGQPLPFVATKCSRRWDEKGKIFGSLRKEDVKRECEDSLRRLGIERIDLYQVHWPDPSAEIEEGWEAITDLVHEGKVRYAGVSNFDVNHMHRLARALSIVSLQPPYSLLVRDIEKSVLSYCRDHRIGVIPYSPLQKGLLTGRWSAERSAALPADDHRARDRRFHGAALTAGLAVQEVLIEVARQREVSAAAVAVAWVLSRKGVTSAIVGARRPGQILEVLPGGDLELTEKELATLTAASDAYQESMRGEKAG